jgi:hypothetical protein
MMSALELQHGVGIVGTVILKMMESITQSWNPVKQAKSLIPESISIALAGRQLEKAKVMQITQSIRNVQPS